MGEAENMNGIVLRVVGILFGIITLSAGASAETPSHPSSSEEPLAPFERLIGGKWHTEGSYQEFAWGVGRRSVTSSSYFLIDGEPRLVSEGLWYWHPGEERIKGVFTAVDMPVVLFDYTTRFEGDQMVNELLSYDASGSEHAYKETWNFTGGTHYVWKLYRMTPEGLREEMGATYEKKK